MNKKFLFLIPAVLVLAAGMFYAFNGNLLADDKDKNCANKTECTKSASNQTKTGCESELKAGSNFDNKDWTAFEFVTDKVSCEGSKSEFKTSLMNIKGVKEVNFGETCKVSNQTNVKVYFSPEETSSELISASVKESKMDCSSKCGSKKNKDSKEL